MAGLSGCPRTATVTAIDDVSALVLPSDEFERLWRSEPKILSALVHALIHGSRLPTWPASSSSTTRP